MTSVNAIEVGTKLIDNGIDARIVRSALVRLRVPIVAFDVDLATIAIELRDRTRSFGLSLADRACLALAIREGATAVTTDRVWGKLDIGCKIELIR